MVFIGPTFDVSSRVTYRKYEAHMITISTWSSLGDLHLTLTPTSYVAGKEPMCKYSHVSFIDNSCDVPVWIRVVNITVCKIIIIGRDIVVCIEQQMVPFY